MWKFKTKSKFALTFNLVVLSFSKLTLSYNSDNGTYLTKGHFLNEWAVRVKGGLDAANQLAKELGYLNKGIINGFDDIYLMSKSNHQNRTKRHAIEFTKQLKDDTRVVWAEQQIARVRVKRDIMRFGSKWDRYRSSDPLERGKNNPFPQEDRSFDDPLWPHQWYLQDTRNMPNLPKLDLGVKEVWSMGFTGKGVICTILDDGLDWKHPDIFLNYDKNASYDANDDDFDPMPRFDKFDSNSHGTRCAGEIAMVAQNKICGVGIAYNARIGGIRCLDGDVSDITEAVALGYNLRYIDIYSSSWGPNDDGMTVDGPKHLATEAIFKGITYGRNGKGCIYVWASGNGGMKGDNCNCDGYASSIYTISIGSASQTGQFPWYGERCASTMAVTYSSGAYTDQKIVTIDLHKKCTIDHSGTSAAAPLAAGILALVLEANPSLTWRDMQHLIVCTAQFSPLMENKSWKRNAAGFMYNSRFGFGLLEALSIVKAALNWKTVPPKFVCTVQAKSSLPRNIGSGDEIQINFIVDRHLCSINFLEHTQLNLDLDYTRRGHLEIILVSAQGSVTVLLAHRPKDTSVLGLKWNLTSLHLWGENPSGHWRLIIRDSRMGEHKGQLKEATLVLHGTRDPPGCLRFGPRRYKDEDLIPQTVDNIPEYLEDNYDQNKMPNALKRLQNPTRVDWMSDFIGLPL